jgi:hypothetical protein
MSTSRSNAHIVIVGVVGLFVFRTVVVVAL